MKEVTEAELKELGACQAGINWFLAWQGSKDLPSILRGLIESDRANWANWLILRYFNGLQKIQYAIFAAELVLHIFEQRYPDDKRPRRAIEAAKAYIKDPSAANANAVDAAAAAAYDATYAADAADARKSLQLKLVEYGIILLESTK